MAALVAYLTGWRRDRTPIADRMMTATLRNHKRGMYQVNRRASSTTQASTALSKHGRTGTLFSMNPDKPQDRNMQHHKR